jgi:4-hydroxymandelate oxidase
MLTFVQPLNLREIEELAREKLPRIVYDYYAGGADDEIALRENVAAYARLFVHHRVLVDVSDRSQVTTVLGERIATPVLVAPTAFHRLAHPDGELATARAAGASGTIMIVSSLSTTAVEDVVTVATGPVWFQLYVYKDREATRGLVERAEAAGCKALVLTVDVPASAVRERDVRNRFALPEGLSIANLVAAGYGAMPDTSKTQASGLGLYIAERLDPSVSWKDVAWLRSVTRLPILLKGVVRADDARKAVDAGVAGIVVSNHGGRQLDSSPPTIEALPRVADAVAGRCEVLVDGGVRRGTDVVKALALGAKAVLVGRPILWGLALDGEAGVRRVLEMLKKEVDLAMGLAGCRTVADATRDLVVPPP